MQSTSSFPFQDMLFLVLYFHHFEGNTSSTVTVIEHQESPQFLYIDINISLHGSDALDLVNFILSMR